MSADGHRLEDQIEAVAVHAANVISKLADAPYLRVGVMKEGVKEFIWALYEQMPDVREELAEALEIFPDLVREKAEEDAKASPGQ